jgi:hypothetical protein
MWILQEKKNLFEQLIKKIKANYSKFIEISAVFELRRVQK